ncbi:glyoxylate/hydroxypyruvate reductase A [Xylophilus sp. GOD-11R]|uniref:2-hydroxyacid dehydrogenase n=1 Tax=Xylophilus sp. GOD-11R TaxID=3089814 RepID=UPI00298C9ECE|nr:glyoxylate/hydroxypyruvate reductase A [Xylophilus sp. GOD-11R]WPB55540.1 glyoxylate/hydroxypyruvate reductase A [Xylophilus sp. GOD-11R]
MFSADSGLPPAKVIALAGPYLYKLALQELLSQRLPDWSVVRLEDPAAAQASLAVCWDQPADAWAQLPAVRALHSIGAGVDNLLRDPHLPALPVCRVVDDQLVHRMTEYVCWGTLFFHRGFDAVLRQQPQAEWKRPPNRDAADVTVGMMGLGEIGGAIAGELARSRYRVRGWARSARSIDGVEVFQGEAGLGDFLDGLDILVCMLPLTPATQGILSRPLFDRMSPGAKLIHCGRGGHLVEADLLAALDAGQLGGALLDVFEKEPLAATSALWSHPKVVVTPHMAAVLPMPAVADQVADNARRLLAGEPLLRVVDRALGY